MQITVPATPDDRQLPGRRGGRLVHIHLTHWAYWSTTYFKQEAAKCIVSLKSMLENKNKDATLSLPDIKTE